MNYSIAKSIVKNTSAMMSGQVITWVSGFVLLLLLPRYLGSQAFGRLYLAISIQLIFQWLIDYGGANYVPKGVARDQSHESVSELMTDSTLLRIGLWFISLVLTLTLCLFAKYSFTEIVLIMVLGISNLWTNMTTLLRECYQGFEAMKYPSIASIIERIFLMLTAVPALLLGAKEIVIIILMAASTLFSFGITLKYSKSMFRFNRSIRVEKLKKLIKEGLPYFLWSLFGVIYYRIDSVLLSMMTPDSVIGWYGAAYRFFDILMFLPVIFSQALYPILSRLSTSEYNSMKTTSQKSLQFLVLAGIPITWAIIFFAQEIIQTLFGLSQYAPSVVVLQIFAISIPLFYADFVLGNIVLALDKQKQWAVVAFGAMVVNIGLNLFLIKFFQSYYGNGGIGSAIATGLTEVFVMACAIHLLPKGMFTKKLFIVITKGTAAGVMMALTIIGTQLLSMPWIVQAAAGVIIYLVSLIVFITFEPEEIELITRAISIKGFSRVTTIEDPARGTGKG